MEVEGMRSYKRKNYSWAIFLVLLGIIFLLNTTGLVGWGIWVYSIRFWPILIVIIGINLVLGNSIIAKILEIFFTVLFTIAIFLVSYIQYTGKGFDFVPTNINEWVLKGGSGVFNLSRDTVKKDFVIEEQEYTGIEQRTLKIDLGASKFTIDEQGNDSYLLVKSEYPKIYNEPELLSEQTGNVLDITFEGASSKMFNLFSNESEYGISIGRLDVPTSLDIKLGAGEGYIEVDRVSLVDMYSDVGAGKLEVTLSKGSIPSGTVRLNVGAGSMLLVLPDTIGYRFEYDLGVGKITIDGEEISDFSSGDGEYISDNYESSKVKLDMVITVGVGSLNIVSE